MVLTDPQKNPAAARLWTLRGAQQRTPFALIPMLKERTRKQEAKKRPYFLREQAGVSGGSKGFHTVAWLQVYPAVLCYYTGHSGLLA
jgi:hypothetical protein